MDAGQLSANCMGLILICFNFRVKKCLLMAGESSIEQCLLYDVLLCRSLGRKDHTLRRRYKAHMSSVPVYASIAVGIHKYCNGCHLFEPSHLQRRLLLRESLL